MSKKVGLDIMHCMRGLTNSSVSACMAVPLSNLNGIMLANEQMGQDALGST
jgi:hypothetical protein